MNFRTIPLVLLVLLLCVPGLAAAASSEKPAGDAGTAPAESSSPDLLIDLRHASELRKSARYEEARAVYEADLRSNPDSGRLHFEIAYTLYLESYGEGTSARGKALRRQAYQLSHKAAALGFSDGVLDMLLTGIDEDGRDLSLSAAYSPKPEADAAIKQAEKLYSQGHLDEALEFYQQALTVDPRAYAAVLFSGDVFFTKKDFVPAMEWFAKAVALDPNRETADRYWADALMKLGRIEEARQHYLNAVIAEPYNRLPRDMLAQHAAATHLSLNHPAVALPRVEIKMDGEKPAISYDPAGGPAVMAYALARVTWIQKERANYFSKDAPVRHSLPEEASALREFCQVITELAAKDPAQTKAWTETVAALQSLDRTGLLEAYVLLDRADQGIAADYPAYRAQHRAELNRYLREVWLGLK